VGTEIKGDKKVTYVGCSNVITSKPLQLIKLMDKKTETS